MIDEPLTTDPPIQGMPGNGFTVRLWNEGGNARALARRHARRRYDEGVQYAFHYYKEPGDERAQLARLARWLWSNEDEMA